MLLLTVINKPLHLLYSTCYKQINNYCLKKMSSLNMLSEETIFKNVKNIVPKLTLDLHKGSNGRLCVIGGSTEFTGAPYFAAISALKTGCDLIHVICTKESAPVIKSYSPEVIVHPFLDVENGIQLTEALLPRFHTIVIGPGLGREPKTMDVVTQLISICRRLRKPLVIDADGLHLVATNPRIIQNYPLAILTPNAMEFSRIFKTEIQPTLNVAETIDKLQLLGGDNVVVVRKGQVDSIFDCKNVVSCSTVGSARRCGGQGDLLSGSLGTFLMWALADNIQFDGKVADLNLKAMVAAYAACRLTRECNLRAFKKHGRSMVVTDMIQEIHNVFTELFEHTS